MANAYLPNQSDYTIRLPVGYAFMTDKYGNLVWVPAASLNSAILTLHPAELEEDTTLVRKDGVPVALIYNETAVMLIPAVGE